jgi:LamB porin
VHRCRHLQVFLTRHLSLTGDCGFDRTHLAGSYDGWLRKCVFAPQIGADRKFFGRPVLRAFVTYGNWSRGFRGLVGGVPFENETRGLPMVSRSNIGGNRKHHTQKTKPNNCGEVAIYSNTTEEPRGRHRTRRSSELRVGNRREEFPTGCVTRDSF